MSADLYSTVPRCIIWRLLSKPSYQRYSQKKNNISLYSKWKITAIFCHSRRPSSRFSSSLIKSSSSSSTIFLISAPYSHSLQKLFIDCVAFKYGSSLFPSSTQAYSTLENIIQHWPSDKGFVLAYEKDPGNSTPDLLDLTIFRCTVAPFYSLF